MVSGSTTGSPTGQTDGSSCVVVSLSPSPVVYFAIAASVVLGVGLVRRSASEIDARQILKRFSLIVAGIALVALVVSQVWFALTPIQGASAGGIFFTPYFFGDIDILVIR